MSSELYQPALLDQIRETNPVVLSVTNNVTIADVANAINAIGASPIMPAASDESPEMAAIADAVTINLGTWTPLQVEQMQAVGAAAIAAKLPVVIDPVAVALPTRKRLFKQLMTDYPATVIRANAGEIAAIAGQTGTTKGIDAGTVVDPAIVAATVAKEQHALVVMTGATDYVSDGTVTVKVENGTPLFARHVGSGDILDGILSAYLAVAKDPLAAVVTATAQFSALGQWVVQQNDLAETQPGSFAIKLIDGLASVTAQDLDSIIKVEEVQV